MLSSGCRGIEPHLKFKQETLGSSRVSKWESSLLSSCLGELRIALDSILWNQASFRVEEKSCAFSGIGLEGRCSFQVASGICGNFLSCK